MGKVMENVMENVHVQVNESSDLNVECQTCSEAPTAVCGSKDHDPPTFEPTGDDDRVTIGPKQEDESSLKKLANLDETVVEEIYVDRRYNTFFFHNRANLIRKIYRENRGVHVTFPPSGSGSCKVLLEGAKRHVNTAKLAMFEVVADLEDHAVTQCDETVVEEIIVDRRHYRFFLHNRANLIRKIYRENGGVHVSLPPYGSDSSQVLLKGAKRHVNTAKLAISEVVADLEDHAVVEEIIVDRRHHRFFFRNRANLIQKISRENGGVHISFPSHGSDSSKVLLEGAKWYVNTAKFAISEVVAELERHVVIQCDERVVEEMDIDRRHQIFFLRNRGNLIEKISRENGRVRITFPPAGSDSSKVLLEGTKLCVNKAKLAISEVVADLESLVGIQCVIPRKHLGTVIGPKGVNARALCQEYNVDIAFPKRAAKRAVRIETGSGSGDDNKASAIEDATHPRDVVVTIKGREEENCLKVKEALLDLVPREIAVDVPFRLHCAIFGQHYESVRSIGFRYGVWIEIPHPRLRKDCVYVRGASGNCEETKEALLKRVEQLQDGNNAMQCSNC